MRLKHLLIGSVVLMLFFLHRITLQRSVLEYSVQVRSSILEQLPSFSQKLYSHIKAETFFLDEFLIFPLADFFPLSFSIVHEKENLSKHNDHLFFLEYAS